MGLFGLHWVLDRGCRAAFSGLAGCHSLSSLESLARVECTGV